MRWLIAAIAAAGLLRRRCRPPSATVRTAAEVAEAVAAATVARMEAAERRALDRRTAVVVVAALVTAVVCVPLAIDRDPVPASLSATGARAIHTASVSEPSGRGFFAAQAQLRRLLVAVDPGATPTSRRVMELELLLPVLRHRCQELAARIGGACGDAVPPPPLPGDAVSLTWEGTALLDLRADELRSVRVETAPGDGRPTRTLRIETPKLIARFSCIEDAAFVLTTFEQSIAHRPGPCPEGSSREMLRLRVAFRGLVPTATPASVASMQVTAAGRRARVAGRDAVLLVDRSQTSEDGPVTLQTAQARGVRLAIDAPPLGAATTTSLVAPAAESVVVHESERVPDEFTSHRDIWLGLIAAVLTLVVATLVDRHARLR